MEKISIMSQDAGSNWRRNFGINDSPSDLFEKYQHNYKFTEEVVVMWKPAGIMELYNILTVCGSNCR